MCKCSIGTDIPFSVDGVVDVLNRSTHPALRGGVLCCGRPRRPPEVLSTPVSSPAIQDDLRA